ncbi:MAG: isoaspartyl peptidase/L-asparaginase [Planctomycetes bacterium]|nr:isoaspartyl peptidase/L-asparaginase [Planctomycetota bacterium]
MTHADDTQLPTALPRRAFLGSALGAGAAFVACNSVGARAEETATASSARRAARKDFPVLVGSNNALPGMKLAYPKLLAGADPLDCVIDVVKVPEADPKDDSVGLGGLPNEDGVVQLDAACMYGPRHKSGAVGCLENIMHPSEVARLVLERTDHCLLVGKDAYRFARAHGHEHVELLTEASRKKWMQWKENASQGDDRLPPPPKLPFQGALPRKAAETHVAYTDERAARRAAWMRYRQTGTIHCSGLARDGAIACTTTTSGLSWKIPGRVGDSPIIGAGLYCDQEAGSAGATGRGEANILANGGFAIVELMRQGASPREAAFEVLRRVTRQTTRQARYQPDLVDAQGLPSFNLIFYVLGLDGAVAGVALRQPKGDKTERTTFAVSTPDEGPRLLPVEALHEV